MRNLGATLLGLGILSFVLPLVGMQFQLVELLGDTPGVRIGMIVIGAVLLFLSREPEEESVVAEKAAPATAKDEAFQIEQIHAAARSPRVVSGSQHFCPHCGHHIVGQENFCGKCGQPVEQVRVVERRCPHPACRHVIPPGKRFCTHCGRQVAAGA